MRPTTRERKMSSTIKYLFHIRSDGPLISWTFTARYVKLFVDVMVTIE